MLFASTFIACTNGASAQEIESKTYLHSIDTCPISPLIKIYAVHYNYEFSPRNELITGLGYTNIDYP
ncbi:MAG TPA: hypothetical protein DD435_01730, partial [Cyanobacteria bacterium UBA8530]|nr:hypothetical protein [Cyanobacteria bacterium UBA8530]